jgi:putative intracellular protease/amidase
MRVNLKTAALVVLLAAATAASLALFPPGSETASWICPPCSGGCDDKVFDRAGSCPVCGMALVAKSAAGAFAAATGQKEEKPLRLAVLLFPGVEIIDYTGPWEVFGQTMYRDRPAFEIYSVAETTDPLLTAMGMKVIPRYTFSDAPAPDVMLLPGGNVRPQLENAAVLAWVRDSSRGAKVVFSVCNGAFFLAKAGLLDGLEATTFASLIPALQKEAPKARVVSDRRFVDNGKVVTAAGLSSGIDGALHVVEKLFGRGHAQVVATGLEYNWEPESGWARAMLADQRLNPVYSWVHQFSDRTVVRHAGTADRWETQWTLTSEKSGAEILKDLRSVVEKQKWTADGGGASTTAWRFSDRDGRAWKGSASVETGSSDPKSRVLTVRVARAGLS